MNCVLLLLMIFSQAKADAAVRFFEEYLRHGKGRFAGAPFRLPPWQKKIIADTFGTLREDGTRQYRIVFLELPRKNGKSELAAGVALKLLFADSEPGAEIYSAAADRNQAAIVYRTAQDMVYRSNALRSRAKVIESRMNIAYPRTGGFYRVVSADGGRQHGLNPHGVIFDELHVQRNRKLFDAMTTGSGARDQPLFFFPTTCGVPDEAPVWWELHELSRMIRAGTVKDPSFLPIYYGAEGMDPDDPKTWSAANPAMGDFLRADEFREKYERAKKLPTAWTEFLRYNLNVPVQEARRWLPVETWDQSRSNYTEADLEGQVCVAAIDLSTRRDITALALLFPQQNGELWGIWRFWLPEDNVPLHLRPFTRPEGGRQILLTEGGAVDYGAVRDEILALSRRFRLKTIAYDAWNASQLAQELTAAGLKTAEVRFGVKSMNAPSKEFEAAYIQRRLRHNGNGVMRYMLGGCSIRSDANGNIIPVKPDRLKSHHRIDGVVATIMALDVHMRSESRGRSIFELL